MAQARGGTPGKTSAIQPPDAEIIGLVNKAGSVRKAALAYGAPHRTFARWHDNAIKRFEKLKVDEKKRRRESQRAEGTTPAQLNPSVPSRRVIDPSDREAMQTLTLEVLADTAAGSFRDADRIAAAKALRDALKLNEVPISDSEAAGGFSAQDSVNLRSVQRMLGSLLQHAIAGMISRLEASPPEDPEVKALHEKARDLYRAWAQPKARPEVAEELVGVLVQVGAEELYRDMPVLEALIA